MLKMDIIDREPSQVSLLSSIGKGITNLAQQAIKPLAAATPFVPALAPLTAVAGVITKLAPSTSPVKVPTPTIPTAAPQVTSYAAPPLPTFNAGAYSAPQAQAGGGGGIIGDVVGGVIGGVVNKYLPAIPGFGGSTGVATTGCGCSGGSHGRDPCTHQRLGTRNNPAPLATFFGGCCPPGRVLRRKPMGRDICIKQPRMNVFNPRALARADMRITGFVRRAAPILHDMGFKVERTRHAHGVKIKGRKRGRR